MQCLIRQNICFKNSFDIFMQIKNKELSHLFSQLALYFEIQGVPFKPQAFLKVKETLETLKEDVEKIYQKEGFGGLENIPGVGKGIAGKIEEYLKTGEIQELQVYRKKMPVNIEELTLVEGIGPKMIKELWEHLKIKNLEEFERAASEFGLIQKEYAEERVYRAMDALIAI